MNTAVLVTRVVSSRPTCDPCHTSFLFNLFFPCGCAASLIACSVCKEGYFEQFGLCKQCPASKSLSALALLAMAGIVAMLGALAFKARHGLPVDVIKLGISTYVHSF